MVVMWLVLAVVLMLFVAKVIMVIGESALCITSWHIEDEIKSGHTKTI